VVFSVCCYSIFGRQRVIAFSEFGKWLLAFIFTCMINSGCRIVKYIMIVYVIFNNYIQHFSTTILCSNICNILMNVLQWCHHLYQCVTNPLHCPWSRAVLQEPIVAQLEISQLMWWESDQCAKLIFLAVAHWISNLTSTLTISCIICRKCRICSLLTMDIR
jgi:hypothetical protein